MGVTMEGKETKSFSIDLWNEKGRSQDTWTESKKIIKRIKEEGWK